MVERIGALAWSDVAGVVFDLDGTLIDSEKAICAAASLAFADVGLDVDEAAVADHLGAPLDELFEAFAGAALDVVPSGAVDDDAHATRRRHFIDRYIAHHDDHPDRDPPPLPGVVDGLRALRARGLPLMVATTKPTWRALAGLQASGLTSFFAHIQGTDPPMKPKPAKDVVVAACAAVGVDPRRAVMVGDTARDVGAARAAGSVAVVVAYGMHRIQLAPALGADLVIRSLVDLIEADR